MKKPEITEPYYSRPDREIWDAVEGEHFYLAPAGTGGWAKPSPGFDAAMLKFSTEHFPDWPVDVSNVRLFNVTDEKLKYSMHRGVPDHSKDVQHFAYVHSYARYDGRLYTNEFYPVFHCPTNPWNYNIEKNPFETGDAWHGAPYRIGFFWTVYHGTHREERWNLKLYDAKRVGKNGCDWFYQVEFEPGELLEENFVPCNIGETRDRDPAGPPAHEVW